MLLLNLFLATLLFSCCVGTTIDISSIANVNDATIVSDIDIDHRDLAPQKKRILGECQGNCAKKSNVCSPGLKCSRYHQKTLVKAGYDAQSAYCSSDPKKGNKGGKFVCYDPLVVANPRCPSGPGTSCDPTVWDPSVSCYVLPVDTTTSCCRRFLSPYNTTHSSCSMYPSCIIAKCSCVMATPYIYQFACFVNDACGGYLCA